MKKTIGVIGSILNKKNPPEDRITSILKGGDALSSEANSLGSWTHAPWDISSADLQAYELGTKVSLALKAENSKDKWDRLEAILKRSSFLINSGFFDYLKNILKDAKV